MIARAIMPLRKVRQIMRPMLALMLTCPVLPALAQSPEAEDRRFLHFGAETAAPIGYSAMCRDLPELCRSFAGETAETPGGLACPGFVCLMRPLPSRQTFPLPAKTSAAEPLLLPLAFQGIITPFTLAPLFAAPPPAFARRTELAMIAQINARVNRQVRQREDIQTYGQSDVWRPSGSQPGATGDCEDLALEKRRALIASGVPARSLFMAIAFRRDMGLHAVLVARLPDGDRILDSRDAFIRRPSQTSYAWLSLQGPDTPDRWFYPA